MHNVLGVNMCYKQKILLYYSVEAIIHNYWMAKKKKWHCFCLHGAYCLEKTQKVFTFQRPGFSLVHVNKTPSIISHNLFPSYFFSQSSLYSEFLVPFYYLLTHLHEEPT